MRFLLHLAASLFIFLPLGAKAQLLNGSGNALFADDASYHYNVSISCTAQDTFSGSVLYVPRDRMTATRRKAGTFRQAIQFYVNKEKNEIYLQEGWFTGKLPPIGIEACYMAGTLSFLEKEGETYCLGHILGTDDGKDSCSDGYAYLHFPFLITEACKHLQDTNAAAKVHERDALEQLYDKVFADSTAQDFLNGNNAALNTDDIPLLGAASMQTLEYSSSKLLLQISDYDTEDDDLISIYYNGAAIKRNHRLSATPMGFYKPAYNKKHPSDTLCIEAHNTGMVAPNSLLLTVQDGSAVHAYRTAARAGDKVYLVLRKKKK